MTVVFSDLVGSTAIATSLEPEQVHRMLDAYQHAVAGAVESRGGSVVQFQGDGVISYFGWPATSETATCDALDAALDVVAAVSRLGPGDLGEGAPRLSARVGVHTGLSVVTPPDAGVAGPADVLGGVAGLAALVQALAEPGGVAVSESTAAMVRGWFDLAPAGSLVVGGLQRRVAVHRVLRPTGTRSRLDLARLGRFFGRSGEIRRLGALWQQVRETGRPQVVALVGEAGIGKSRLAREHLVRTAGGPQGRSLVAACSERDRLSPLHPLSTLLGSTPPSPAEAARAIVGQAGTGPTRLLLEDAHWADPSTLEAIAEVAVLDRPVMVLLTCRPGGGDHAALATESIVVGPLGEADSEAVVRDATGDAVVSDELRRSLVRRGGGVPLFLEELSRTVRDATHRPRAGEQLVPATLAETLMSRLDRLGPAKRTAQVAAVMGAEFDLPSLARVSGAGEAREQAHLAVLGEHLVVEASGGPGCFRFRHALLREAAYQSLLVRDRRSLHGRFADILGAQEGHPQCRPEVIAAHLATAGRSLDSVTQWMRAARSAARRAMWKEAGAHLGEALERLAELEPGGDRDLLEMKVRMRLGAYRGAIDQAAADVGVHLRRGLELARACGDPPAQVECALTLVAHHQAVSDYGAVHRVIGEATRVATSAGMDAYLPLIAIQNAAIAVWQGDLEGARSGIAEAIDRFGLAPGRPPTREALAASAAATDAVLMIDVVVAGYVMYGLLDWLTGSREEAFAHAAWASDLAAECSATHAQCLAWTTRAIIHQLDGDATATGGMARSALSLADDRTTSEFRGWSAALLEWAEGRPPKLPALGDRPALFMRSYLLSLQAERTADPVAAVALADAAITISRTTTERFSEARLLTIKAERLAELGDLDAAAGCLEEAVALADGQGAAAFARAARELQGRLRTGDPPGSRGGLPARWRRQERGGLSAG